MKKRIFITGAAGFVGFHLALALKQRGDDVLGYDNFNDYYAPSLKRDRTKKLKDEGISVSEGDICSSSFLKKELEQFGPTHIVHLAAQAGVRYSLDQPHTYVKSNVEGFLNILELCRRHPSVKLVYASSSSIYGTNTKIPFAIDDPTDHPASLYGATKKSNELMAHAYHHCFGISTTGLRFFTVYGPWGRPDMAYFSFARAIVEGKPIKLFNHGNVQRDFTYIDDIVAGILSAVDLGAAHELFNLGHHHPVYVKELVELLEHELGKKAIKEEVPMQTGDVLITYADISHSADKLKFAPTTTLADGIAKFATWFKEYCL